MPSSTQAMVVVWAPMSTTQAFERPAPNVAHIASYPKYQHSITNGEGRALEEWRKGGDWGPAR